MQNLSPRPVADATLRTVSVTLLLLSAAALFTFTSTRAQQPPQRPAKTDAQSRELTHTNETTKVATLPPQNKRYAVIIGIDRYNSPDITALAGAANDAKNLADALEHYAGFPHQNIYVLTSDQKDPDMQPTRTNIIAALGNLSSQIGKGGMLWVAFSGHGVDDSGTAYLLPQDAKPNRRIIKDVSISVPDLTGYIKSTGAGQVLLMLDACRDDPFASNKGVADANPMDSSFKSAEKSFAEKNSGISAFVTLYAAKEGQRAWEDKKNKRGYFTDTLIDALKGEAGTNDNGDVTLASVVKYLHEQLPTRVKHGAGLDKVQEPTETISDSFDAARLVISRVDKPKPVAAPVAANVGAAGGPITPTLGTLSFISEQGAKVHLTPVDGGEPQDAVMPSNKQSGQLAKVKPGRYVAVASLDGYETTNTPVEIKAGENPLLVLPLRLKTYPVTVTANVPTGSVKYWNAGDPTRKEVTLQDGKTTLPALPKGSYSYEVKTDGADFSAASGTFKVPEDTTVSVKLDRTSTSPYSLAAAKFDPSAWTSPGVLTKTAPFMLTVAGSGVTYLSDDRYQHYADFQLDVESVRMVNELALSFAMRVQDAKNYYLVQLTGAKSNDPFALRTYIVRDGRPTLLRRVTFEKSKEALTPQNQVHLTFLVAGKNLTITLHNNSTGDDFSSTAELDPANTFPKGGLGFASTAGEKFEIGLINVCAGKCGGQ